MAVDKVWRSGYVLGEAGTLNSCRPFHLRAVLQDSGPPGEVVRWDIC